MKIDSKTVTSKIYPDLQARVGELRKNNIKPHLTVILIGHDPASKAYVHQKQKWGEFIGAEITVINYPNSVTMDELKNKINQLNSDPDIHAIIVQRPVPPQISTSELNLIIKPEKDIDGFHPDSSFTLPLPLSVMRFLEEIYFLQNKNIADLIPWLKKQKIAVIGKGQTGGEPIYEYLRKKGINSIQIDSKTINPDSITKTSDIIISAVGKPDIIKPENIKKGVILIGVGIFRGKDGKLHGDYNEKKIEQIVSYYTPTPGGVGPVNVATLLENLLEAATKK